jgi:pilus assembly protein FimV
MAIGIGDMTVRSYINQPLQANIAVLQPDGLLESEVIASLASPDDFDRLGLERHYSLNSLRFAADFSRSSRPIITVTTDDPVLEPYLSFLLELKWPEGRVLREYTVFLDLPPRRASQSSSNSSGRGLQPFGEVSVDQYRVAPNDTLGGIAAALKPSELTIDQMMLAIKAANPNSFMRDNINGIRVGVLLAIPSDFSDVPSARAASREVANEWDRWKAPRSSGLRIVADNELLDFAEPSNDSKLVSEEAMEPEPTNVAPSNSSTDDNQSDLALIEARLMALSEQLSDIQEVVDSKDLEIARLKAELAERPVRGVTPTAASDTEPAPASQAASEGGSSLISGLFWFILAAGLIAIGWFNRHRLTPNERGRDEKADISAPSALSGGLDELLPVPSQLGSQPDNEPATGPERGYGESLLTGYAADQTLADAVAEADIYVAYGRHQHALDTLEAASAAEPSNASGLLKMLDIYMSLDRIDEATGLLVLIEGTGDTVALESAKSRLDSHQASLSGDDAAHELASLDNAEPEVEASDDTLDISLDLEFQEAAKPAPEDAEADASGALDAEDPAETALDLALAYIDMGDKAGAADLLQTVLSSGDEAQREHAQSLLDSLE